MGRMILIVFLGLAQLALAAPLPAQAQVSQPIRQLSDALQIAETVKVLREEGLANAAEIAADLPGGPGDTGWQSTVSRIYDPEKMRAEFDAALEAELGLQSGVVAEAGTFFASTLGARALRLELDARRALVDPAVKLAAAQAFDAMSAENSGRRTLIERFVAANDLVELNVMGSLNSNFAFFKGLAEEGGEGFAMSEADMLDEVWSGEAKARQETIDWLFPFLTLAYESLTEDELQAYVDFSLSPAGRTVNAAMFAAFDRVFTTISNDLGRAVARQMKGEDI